MRFRTDTILTNRKNPLALKTVNNGGTVTPSTCVLLRLDTNIGAGIVFDGRLNDGRHFVAREIGHMLVHASAAARPANARGYLETVAGRDRVPERLRAIRRAASARDMSEGALATIAGNRSRARRALFEDVELHLGSAIANLASVLDPGAVILLATRGPDATLQGAPVAGFSAPFEQSSQLHTGSSQLQIGAGASHSSD